MEQHEPAGGPAQPGAVARRPLVLLFTDVEGSSRSWEEDPATMAVALARHDAILRATIAGHGGHVFKTVGDGFCAIFAEPGGAIGAALAIQRSLATAALPTPLHVRVALHAGEAEARDGDYFGPALNRVARLLAAAHGGQILLSEPVAAATLPPGTSLRDLGLHRLRDLRERERIYQLIAPDLPAEFPPPRTDERAAHHLPAPPNPLIGRDPERAHVVALLRDGAARLITLTGPGGIGKTRLAIALAGDLAGDFAGGAHFVPLAAVSDADLLIPTLARSVGLRDGGGSAPREPLLAFLRQERPLLVLDNLEQIAGAAPLVADLLAACPDLRVLATSRGPLRLRGEREIAVGPLAPASAIALFLERARAVQPALEETAETAATVAEIVRRLDGLPLAIELAAARSRLYTPAALLRRLDRRLPLLSDGARDLPPRHQTLRAAIAWSFDLLTPAERDLFTGCAVFAGGWTGESAATVLEHPDPVSLEIALESLVDAALAHVTTDPDGEPRFAMLETVREFGTERLAAVGRDDLMRRRHAACFLALAEEAAPALTGPDQARWLDRIAIEHDNLRAALDWLVGHGEGAGAIRLAIALTRFWRIRGHLVEGSAWLTRVLALVDAVPDTLRARAIDAAGIFAHDLGDYDRAVTLHEAALHLFAAARDTAGAAEARANLATAALYRGDHARADTLFRQHVAECEEHGNPRGAGVGLNGLGMVAFWSGDYAAAVTHYAASVAIWRRLDDPDSTAIALANLGHAELMLDQPARAATTYAEAEALFARLGDRGGVAFVRSHLGRVAEVTGDLPRAAALYAESLRLARELGERQTAIEALEGLAGLACAGPDPDKGVLLAAAATAARTGARLTMPAHQRAQLDRCLATARLTLDEAAYTAAWSRGHTLTEDEVATLADGLAQALTGA